MGQFKPMVKMMTTEPSIELKLKKGGHVAMPKMKSKSSADGHKKMAAGGSALTRSCGTGSNMPNFPKGEMQGTAPAKPTMANRRAAMKGLKQHAALPASKAHKGLKTGGVAMGQGGYKNGGSVISVSASKKGAKGYEETMMHTATPDRSPAKTGDVKMGNGGGYKKGGKVKMAMGGQLPPPSKPRTGGTTTTPTRTMREMLDRARGELSGPRNPGPMPKPKPPVTPRCGTGTGSDPRKFLGAVGGTKKMALGGMTGMVKNAMNRVTAPSAGSGTGSPRPFGPRGSGPNDAGPGRPLPFGGPKYDEYMPGGPKNPLRVPTKKSGGAARYAKGGGVEGNVSSTPAGVTNTTTGGVRKGNAGGFKKGGAPKKFARGGSVNDSGKAEKMPQGYKKPPTPVSINQLSGTYKRGGKVRKYAEGGVSDKEREAYDRFYADEAAENKAEREAFIEAMKNPLDAMRGLPERLRKGYEAISKGLKGSGSVTTTEREVSRTVTPTKKRYGGAC